MAKQKDEKTNVMRILDQKEIPYTPHTYPHEEGEAVDGVTVAGIMGQDPECVFKTLVARGASGALYVFDIPVADSLDLTVVCGDGTFAEVQESADVAHCSAMVAVTGRDEDNLIVCQLAKQVFKVKRTVARVNNPKNAAVLKKLGVDIAVSATDNLTHLIEREVETAAIQQLLSLAGGTASLTQVLIPQGFAHAGKTLAELVIPKDAVVISITRDGELIVPRGNTQILVNDKVVVLAKNTAFHELAQSWNLADVK